MFLIDERNKIYLTKGDTASFTVSLKDLDGNEDIPQGTVTLSVKGNTVVIARDAIMNEGKYTIILYGNDTKDLESGIYTYDIQYTDPNGNNYTPIKESVFEILGDVTR